MTEESLRSLSGFCFQGACIIASRMVESSRRHVDGLRLYSRTQSYPLAGGVHRIR